jgi:hypothetical protein
MKTVEPKFHHLSFYFFRTLTVVNISKKNFIPRASRSDQGYSTIDLSRFSFDRFLNRVDVKEQLYN